MPPVSFPSSGSYVLQRIVAPLLTLVFVLGTGCQSEGGPGTSGASDRPPGTRRMADTLAAIAERAHEHPMDYYYLNARRAEVLKQRIKTASRRRRPRLRLRRAFELLNAGQTEKAIAALNELMRDQRIKARGVTRRTKPLFDLLAASYLRLGEQRNCLRNYTGKACILPIRGTGVHTRTKGSRNAISVYEKILEHDSTNLQARWLYNIAHMTLGQYPEQVPDKYLIPGIAPEPGTEIETFPNVASALGVDHDALSGGVSMEDFNNDGFLDLFVTSYGLTDQVRYYESTGKGGYVDRTKEADLMGITSGLNVVHADYNNDGYEDIFILRGAWLGAAGRHPNSLLRNDGDGTFTDVTYKAGLGARHPTQTAAWADFNRDGYVDLFVGNESGAQVNWMTGKESERTVGDHPSALYLNEGDGTFREVSDSVGLDLNAYVKAVTWGDINGDGWPDLYASVFDGPNKLYVNQGGSSIQDWAFEERALELGVEAPLFSFTSWFWDYNNDGHQDLFVSGYDMWYFRNMPKVIAAEHLGRSTDATKPRLYRNNGDGTFTDVTSRVNLDKALFAMGGNYGDIDNDGFQDFYVGTGAPDLRALIPNRMFINEGGTSFQEVTYAGGFGHLQKGHGVAFGDMDRDGDQEIYSVTGGAVKGDHFRNVLFENPGEGKHWLTLDLVGTTANRSAIGASVTVDLVTESGKQRTLYRTVSTGGSFGASSLQLEIGLGDAIRIDTVTVTWPNADRTTQTFTDIEMNRAYRIVEGKAPTPLNWDSVTFPDPGSGTASGTGQPTRPTE
ncbi:MAG: FG-GAP-like repeat-containing protein [Salinibacter sp.]